ncbi:hypothetical protein [Olavius algarvensis spirochete endosymbiont]|uniref:hypothetical protein n=1 Tax=Olavius algarvensis spirochete endosymbiont TaxID=260710 RepID=UPI000F519CB6|nr:hypothetical protein [Olavius algarvensis spirochete endosymbiont]
MEVQKLGRIRGNELPFFNAAASFSDLKENFETTSIMKFPSRKIVKKNGTEEDNNETSGKLTKYVF